MADLAQLLEKAGNTGEGRVAACHLLVQFDTLNKMYEDEATRDASYILAADWVTNGTPLRKAAATAWALEKNIPVGDKPDPNARQPKPNDLSNGIDAPESGHKAAGAGAAANDVPDQKNPVDDDGKKGHAAPKGKHNVIARLKQLQSRRHVPAVHSASNATAAAYEAGVRDATAKHAKTAGTIGAMAARHAFKLGAEAGHRMGSAAHAQANAGSLPVTQQQIVTHPQMTKSYRSDTLSKAYDEEKHKRGEDGKFTSTGDFKQHPSYIRAVGRQILEAAPGLLLARSTRSKAIRGTGQIAALAGLIHGRYASFANQSREAGSKNPRKSGAKLAAASFAGDAVAPVLGGAIATHAVGFTKSDRATDLAKLAGG